VQNRGPLRLGTCAKNERFATSSFDGTVRVAIAIVGMEKIPSLGDEPEKDAALGYVLRPGDPECVALLRQDVHIDRNAVTYGPDPSGQPRTSACGCRGDVPHTRAFLPGHDQRRSRTASLTSGTLRSRS
jgi:hypothetical protein